jgi:hypothetical protein
MQSPCFEPETAGKTYPLIGIDTQDHHRNIDIRNAAVFQIPDKLFETGNPGGHFVGECLDRNGSQPPNAATASAPPLNE